jgi:ribonucleoside-diphosphate reductase alpha chain
MTNVVTKRDGSKEEYDVRKIKKFIELACQKVGANPLELESKIDQFMKNNIKTKDIAANVIQHAVQLASPQNPEWLQVAGNAHAMDEWASYKLKDKSFREIVKTNVTKGEYTKEILDFYSDEDLDSFGETLDHEKDREHSYASLVTVKKKYLGKLEMNQHMHMVNAMRFGQSEPPFTRRQFVMDAYGTLSDREFSLATPFMSNLRKGGNVSSCFILAIEDDIDSIFQNTHRIAKISKNGGGLGIYLGFLRAKGSSVGGVDGAAGTVVQWIKIINDTLVAVNQGGKRAGAGTTALPLWHNDILDFLDMQSEHGDPRLKAYDVFPQVVANDIFMERDREKGRWVTFCPFEVRNKLGIDVRGLYGQKFTDAYLKIEEAVDAGKLKVFRIFENARELTKIVMRTSFETGLPYWFFADTVNEVNPNRNDPESYGILCANLCTESYSNVVPDKYGHVCNLGSINMGNIRDMDHLAKVARLSCRILNRGIDLTRNPDQITKDHNDRFRTIGIGVMGLHDYFAREYSGFHDHETIRDIFECIEYNAVLESIEIAKEKGSFGAFEFSQWKTGEMASRFAKHGNGKYDWAYAQSQIDLYGIHNSQLTSPAPTTTTSIYQDASASVLPIFSAFFAEDNKNGSMKVAAKFLKQNPVFYGQTQAKTSAIDLIGSVAEMQKFTDTGISMELMFDQNVEGFSAKDLYDAIHHAHQKKIKTIYYIRSIKKNETIGAKEEEACVACSG